MNHPLNFADLGRRVRAARIARGLTLDEVVSRTDFTVSWLSKLENGQLAPSLAGLVEIASVLGCSLDALVAGLTVTPRHVVCRNGDAQPVRPRGAAAGVTVEQRAGSWSGRRMQPAIVHVSREGGRLPAQLGSGERFLLVLEGTVQVTYGDETLSLATGDSMYCDAAVPHAIAAVGRAARLVSVSCDGSGPPPSVPTAQRGKAAGAARRS
jgi:transcriptional regulator with XRE-family HTH domain